MKLKYIGVTCLAILACSDGTESRRLGDGSSGERIAREVVYDTLWTYGGPDDTLLAAPITMAAAPMGGVYVLDAGMRRVYHFADGRLVWSWGTVGQGPGEIWSYPAFTDGWFLGLMVSDVVSFLPRHFTERGKVHRRRGERPGEVRSASVAPALHLRFRPHG